MQITGIKFLKRLKINAIVIYPFVIYAEKDIDPVLENHERIHMQQIRRDGVIFFYTKYFGEYFKFRLRGLSHDAAYREISYEKEAFLNQDNLIYQVTDN